jgi:hypothetical protein
MEVAMTRRTRHLHWLVWTAVMAGCTQWSTTPTGEFAQLPLPKLAPDSVVLEITFIRIPEEHVDFEDRFWPEADESALNAELRRRLAANGFRSGIVGTPPPPALQEVLDRQPAPDLGGGVTSIEAGTEIAVRTHHLRNRAGHPGKIIVRGTPVSKLAALMSDEAGHVRGESLDQAQFYFSIASYPQGDGQVRVELVPTIEHGQPRSRFKGQQGAWTVDNVSRPARTYEDLKIDTLLSPGQSVALGCTTVQRGLGEQFFAADPNEQEPRLLLVVRLQQTQLDERFMDDEVLEPITSVTD